MGFVGFIAVIVFFIICVPFSAFRIESDIYARVREALLAKVLPDSGLSVEGRDVFLTGPIASQELKSLTERTASSVFGVRKVRNYLVVQYPFRRAAAVRQAQQELDAVTRTGQIDFAGETDSLALESRTALDRIVTILKKHTEVQLEVGVRTEWIGGASKAVRLSEKRASAVTGYLIAKGIPGARLTSIGFGAREPIAPRSATEGRVLNSRVELHVK